MAITCKSKAMARENDLGLPDAFIEWLDEIVECNLSMSLPELREYVFKTTGEDFSEAYLRRQRIRVGETINRADRHPDVDHPDSWAGLC